VGFTSDYILDCPLNCASVFFSHCQANDISNDTYYTYWVSQLWQNGGLKQTATVTFKAVLQPPFSPNQRPKVILISWRTNKPKGVKVNFQIFSQKLWRSHYFVWFPLYHTKNGCITSQKPWLWQSLANFRLFLLVKSSIKYEKCMGSLRVQGYSRIIIVSAK